MQNWEEYEADYYGEFPDDRMEWNMRGRRRGMMPYEPEDRIDTRMRDGYGDRMRMDRRMDEDMYPENRMGGSMYPENRMFRDDMEEGLGEMSDRGGRRITIGMIAERLIGMGPIGMTAEWTPIPGK